MIHAYKLAGHNIVLDTASGSIHCVDAAAFDAILIFEKEGKRGAQERIAEIHRELDDDDVSELVSEIEELVSKGKLFAEDAFEKAQENQLVPPVKALCLNVSHTCNMRCSYCFAGRGDYGGPGELMSLDTGIRAIDFLLENSGSRKNLDVDFFGGEPLMNWDVVKGIVNYARSVEKSSGKTFRFTLTTNALLIDDDVIDFTNREMHNIVLSLDGREETNDAQRKMPDGEGSYGRILPNVRRIVEARSGTGYYIRGTFTRDNIDFLKDILHIADLGFTEISMEPVVAKRGEPHALGAADLPRIYEQYELLAHEMIKRNREKRGFSFYHYKLDLTGGPCIHKLLAGCGVGTEYLAVTPSGELYPCHQFVSEKKFLMGDVWQGVSNDALRHEFHGLDIYSREKCRECWARLYCSGGCAANAWGEAGSIDSVYELGCELFKKRLECAIMIVIAETID